MIFGIQVIPTKQRNSMIRHANSSFDLLAKPIVKKILKRRSTFPLRKIPEMCAACISGDASPEAKVDMLSQGKSSETSNSKKGPKQSVVNKVPLANAKKVVEAEISFK